MVVRGKHTHKKSTEEGSTRYRRSLSDRTGANVSVKRAPSAAAKACRAATWAVVSAAAQFAFSSSGTTNTSTPLDGFGGRRRSTSSSSSSNNSSSTYASKHRCEGDVKRRHSDEKKPQERTAG